MKKFFTILLFAAASKLQAQSVGSSLVFTGPTVLPGTPASLPVTGQGTRMMWYPDKAAFRSGSVSGTQWDVANIGRYSFASGFSTRASGAFSTAMGANTTASGDSSTATGADGIASGNVSSAMGRGTAAKAYNSLSVGAYNDNTDNPNAIISAPIDRVFQIGNGTSTTRSNAVTVLRNGNIGLGNMNSPNAALQFANVAANRRIVLWETANNDHQFYGFGINGFTLRYQTASTSDDHVFFSGINSSSSNELFRIRGNGNAVLAGTLTQFSDATLKKNIRPLSYTLSNLQQLKGYTYNWNDNNNPDEQIGLLAQEIQKVYPQLVKEHNGKLSVNYIGMIPVLLEGIKEQQTQINELRKLVHQLLIK